MIKTFKCKETKKIWDGYQSTKLPIIIQTRALKKLRQLDAATHLDDLRVPPGNNLEHLKGDRKGQMSIRINQPWRICFVWNDGGIYDVEIVDYH